MKILTKYTLLVIFLISLFSCEDDNSPTDRDEFIADITGAWTVDGNSQIILDNQNITSLLADFEIVINSDLTFSTNSDQIQIEIMPWPTSGSFIINDELDQFTRNDGLIISVAVDENSVMTLDFQFDEGFDDSQGGRLHGIRGRWTMKITKK